MSTPDNKYIYIVLSKTDTLLGRMIQNKLGVYYNHCSISLDKNLDAIYSFGRKELKNFFRAGFVRESKSSGFFLQHCNSNIIVLKLSVSSNQWQQVNLIINEFKSQSECYKYSALGLLYCYFGIPVKREYKYFCSQFVAELLKQADIYCFEKPESLVRPHDFLDLSHGQVIYKGEIGKYYVA